MTDKTQLEKFKEAARKLDCDDDDERFAVRVGKLVNSTKRSPAKTAEN